MALAQVGAAIYLNAAADEQATDAVEGPCLIFNFLCFNPDATDIAFVQFFDVQAGDVTVGTTPPSFIVQVPANSGSQLALTAPIAFRQMVSYAVTSTPTGAGAPSTDCVVQFGYVGG